MVKKLTIRDIKPLNLWNRTISLVNRISKSSALVTKSIASFGINSDSLYICIMKSGILQKQFTYI